MAENYNLPNNIYSENDTLDINELASLNNDITPEFIEQLQNQVSQNASEFTNEETDDSELFEEITNKQNDNPDSQKDIPQKVNLDESIDDNFIKKYKARLNKQPSKAEEQPDNTEPAAIAEDKNLTQSNDYSKKLQPDNNLSNSQDEVQLPINSEKSKPIENLTGGNIIEKPITQEQKNYNDSLNLLDNNIKYSKYVIYIDPENKEFIESLTVKERKNLINKIIREQDDIAITKRRLTILQTIIKHSIVAIITIAISIPVIYTIINASIEATINNHRQSQSLFKTLYKDTGKINIK